MQCCTLTLISSASSLPAGLDPSHSPGLSYDAVEYLVDNLEGLNSCTNIFTKFFPNLLKVGGRGMGGREGEGEGEGGLQANFRLIAVDPCLGSGDVCGRVSAAAAGLCLQDHVH